MSPPDRELISAERLREVFYYDAITGVFTNRIARSHAQVGAVAGGRGGHGYVQMRVDRRFYLAHRLAWLYVYGEHPPSYLDHVNGDRRDNRIANLRLATAFQNAANAKRYRSNTSGYKGVSYHRYTQKWQARISAGGRRRHLGVFAAREDALAAYMAAAKVLHGEFARVS